VLLGYDSLGRLTLGQISIASAVTPSFSPFGAATRKAGLPIALLAGFTSFVAPPPARAGAVFVTFSQPAPYVYSRAPQQEPWAYEAAPTKRPTGGLFSSFEQQHSYRHSPNNLGETTFKLLPTADPTAPQAGGTSRRLVNGRFVGPFTTAKQAPKPKISLKPLPIPPASPPSRPVVRPQPVEIVKTALPPASMERQALSALDQADVEAFLRQLDQDEQDARDIAEVLALLD